MSEAKIESHIAELRSARAEIAKKVFGQDRVIDLVLTSIIAGGHALLIGVPGLAKTLLVETTATVLGLDNRRIQCTPDLMPADILGSEVLEQDAKGKRSFRFIEGPVFTQLLMADEINRASPRTQSALLQAMQEKQISVAGHAHDLPAPFHVLATQNPLEQEGTYPLPEAQLDRFLLQITVEYPDLEAEKKMLSSTTGNKNSAVKTILKPKTLQDIQTQVRDIPVGDDVTDAILTLVRSLRPQDSNHKSVQAHVLWPPGPRASQALFTSARAYALLDGRLSPSIDDVITLAPHVLAHRMALKYSAAREGVTLETLVTELCNDL